MSDEPETVTHFSSEYYLNWVKSSQMLGVFVFESQAYFASEHYLNWVKSSQMLGVFVLESQAYFAKYMTQRWQYITTLGSVRIQNIPTLVSLQQFSHH